MRQSHSSISLSHARATCEVFPTNFLSTKASDLNAKPSDMCIILYRFAISLSLLYNLRFGDEHPSMTLPQRATFPLLLSKSKFTRYKRVNKQFLFSTGLLSCLLTCLWFSFQCIIFPQHYNPHITLISIPSEHYPLMPLYSLLVFFFPLILPGV